MGIGSKALLVGADIKDFSVLGVRDRRTVSGRRSFRL